MKMVIICPYMLNAEGVVEYYARGKDIVVSYTIRSSIKDKIMRLWALSSKKPSAMPVKIQVPLFENGSASDKCILSETALAVNGYNIDDIDTFVLTYEEKSKINIAAAGFGSLGWDISYSIGMISKQSDDRVFKNALDSLESIKKSKGENGDYNRVITALKHIDNSLTVSECKPIEQYRWYKYQSSVFPLNLSAYNHLVSTMEFINAYQNSRVCLWGVRNICHTALAVKCTGANPFVNAEDCAIYRNGFWVVGVYLKNDGQYFERAEDK